MRVCRLHQGGAKGIQNVKSIETTVKETIIETTLREIINEQ